MPFFWCLSHSDSQNFACSRRELLGKVSAIGAVSLLPQSQPELLVPQNYPLPEFKIGDLVAEDWLDENDEKATDFGQVLGVRYVPEAYSCFAANTWIYYIYWTHSTCHSVECYPCYDGEASKGCDLRLVKQS